MIQFLTAGENHIFFLTENIKFQLQLLFEAIVLFGVEQIYGVALSRKKNSGIPSETFIQSPSLTKSLVLMIGMRWNEDMCLKWLSFTKFRRCRAWWVQLPCFWVWSSWPHPTAAKKSSTWRSIQRMEMHQWGAWQVWLPGHKLLSWWLPLEMS